MIGKRIREARTDRGLTQTAVAQVLGISRAAISQWESGSSKGLKPENLLRLCRLLNLRPDWVVFGEGAMNAGPSDAGGYHALAAIVSGVERLLDEENLVLPADKKGELVALLYQAYVEQGDLPDLASIREQVLQAA